MKTLTRAMHEPKLMCACCGAKGLAQFWKCLASTAGCRAQTAAVGSRPIANLCTRLCTTITNGVHKCQLEGSRRRRYQQNNSGPAKPRESCD